VTAEDVDGGFEWNNFQALDHAESWRGPGPDSIERPDAAYAITFEAAPGEALLARFPVEAWLPRAVTQVLAVKRNLTTSSGSR
jgi:hypothetical protein